MINEKRLDSLNEGLVCLVPRPEATHGITSHEYSKTRQSVEQFCDCELQELIRLSRLGLWAEKHGISTLKRYESNHAGIPSHCGPPGTIGTADIVPVYTWAKAALSALPKDYK